MKLKQTRHRVFAVLIGIALLVIVVMQIWRDGRRLQFKQLKSNTESIKK